jgi:hypothetical protein
MSSSLVMITPPASEPITLDQFKNRAKIFTTADDDDIETRIIPASRQAVEDELRRVLITQTWRLKRDTFPPIDARYVKDSYPTIWLPKPPFQAIKIFTYVDTQGTLQELRQTLADGTVDPNNGGDPFYGYQLDPGSETQPARLNPPWARPWPPARRLPIAVQIEFDCGYGPINSTSPVSWISGRIPPVFIQAIMLQGNHMYYNREAVVYGQNGGVELERGVKRLLAPYVNHVS